MKTQKTESRRRNAPETRRKIYQCADELFRQYGFEKVSVDSIVEKAGISKGAFYVHFPSKDSLMSALIAEYVNKSDFNYRTFEKSFPDDTSVFHILIALVEKIADNIADNVGYNLIKIAYRIQIERKPGTDFLLDYNRDIYSLFRDLVNRGIQSGEFKTEIPVDVIADHFVMALRGLTYEWCIRYPDFDLKKQFREHFEILLSGIKK
ncbi:MAG: TetR/AcrR family transcriptional regulator [Clostridia bacterium]|jgi:AcrR family transcriptional regulator|nr:TetR/AcrR family transcriptional regulator [Clostridia bacterium]MCI2000729.1 TetR/AcrR family transcriptional regulator [Clostridia bacterium]MCI2015198.1 TetR/AcrR family transcriptional regulator [Clostridia bacterium]